MTLWQRRLAVFLVMVIVACGAAFVVIEVKSARTTAILVPASPILPISTQQPDARQALTHGIGLLRDAGTSVANVAEATLYLQQACQGGMALGCARLGDLYRVGSVLQRDELRAASLYQQACAGDAPIGCRWLGIMQREGKGTRRDRALALATLQRACEARDLEACVEQGITLEESLLGADAGGSPDDASAVSLYQLACDQGVHRGCYRLGRMYYHARGVTRDLERARRLFDQACLEGVGAACRSEGAMYGSGYGAARDPRRSLQLFERGCSLDESTCSSLGLQHLTGLNGLQIDRRRGRALLQLACDAGSMEGCHNLGVAIKDGLVGDVDLNQAAALFRRACDDGYAGSCNNLAVLHERGLGVERSRSLALELYRRACELRDVPSCENLRRAMR